MNLTEFIACAKFKNKGNSGLSENQNLELIVEFEFKKAWLANAMHFL